ncbi:heat shock protein 70-like protein [Strawberry pallidosis-associated virus]|uniref:Heat shock protein 70-like protein n=4 Tax=Strawberry pallidosis-associated virus TaxID=227507 RepID=Q805J2_9CLOS|nr:heat shock protein 70-like protein [Strawberry pallidosis-associated virus]AAO92345.1 heat shock protein 70-like protein [Strawberry pallidosis-associated virus]AAS79676.1 heat shock protein 70-like protein [Strawberry pallidosis-associated virus]UDP24125.1 heat shock protein 70-like protein [Strawberry pallidosis-associated virus]UDP24133.1 heat shock protein 70-like protein [Strawberry pallidosis-associated virus]WGV43776.1 heat shock protein 70-like protein [Strawberry pallidosis-associa
MTEAKVGLDFGTTFSTISSYINNKMHVLKINDSPYIPTCLAISIDKDVIIGGAAQVLDSSEVANCYFYDLKRWVGVDKVNFENIKAKINPQYVAKLVNDDVMLTGVDRGYSCTYTVKQLILLYIDTLVRLFSKTDNLNIISLNVSVPADYKCKQRMFMKSVCDSLNFSLRRIINEPSAAAIYSVSKYPNYKYFLMYDFGGGTFDTSLIVRDGKVVTVADTEGDSFLGGRDIDNAISRFIVEKHSLPRPLSSDFLASIKEEVNNSSKSNFIALDTKGNIVNVSFNKDDLATCIQPFSVKSIKILDNLVGRRKITNGALFLVGGSSLLKKIQQDVSSYARSKGLTCVIDEDLRCSVSFGCSMQHAQEDSGSMTYIDCNSHPLMDLLMYGNPKVVVRKPMPIPYTKYDTRTIRQHYNTVVNVYEGSDLFVLNNDWLVSAKVNTSDHANVGEDLTFVYKYTIDGILELYAKNEKTGVEKLLPNTFSLTEKINKLDLQLTQLSTIDESATLISIMSYFDDNYTRLLSLLRTPTILERELLKITSTKKLYSALCDVNKNFNN